MRARIVLIGLACSLVAAVVSPAVGAPAWFRIGPMLFVLIVMPGRAISRRIGDYGQRTHAALTLAVGTSWLVLASEALLYAHWWKPAALIPTSVAISGVAFVVPTYQAAHRVRRAPIGRPGLALALSAAALLLSVQFWAMFRSPYTADELQSLQAAWTWSEHASSTAGRLPLSAMSIVEAVVLPLRHPTTGTLLAARWVALGLLLAAVAVALGWARAFVDRRGEAMTAATLLGVAAFAHGDRLTGMTAVGTPLLLSAGWCLAGPVREGRRFAIGGVLLGGSALSSRTAAVAALGLLAWTVLDGRQRHRTRSQLESVSSQRRVVLGFLATVASGTAAAAVLGLRVPVMVGGGAIEAGVGTASLLAFVPLAILVVAGLLSEATPSARRSVRPRHAPILALVGACSGALVERAPLTSVALLPLLLLALCAASFLWSQDREGHVVVRARSRFRRPGFGLSVGWRAALTAAVLLLPVGAQIADLWGSTNQAQLSRVAYVLDRTGPSEAIFDPSQTVGVFRKRVDRSSLESASFAVVSPYLLARDPSLRDALRAGFQPTPYPGLWRGVLTWTPSGPATASPPASGPSPN